jgi:ABC-type uncharacterized transport system auxiliary subunit
MTRHALLLASLLLLGACASPQVPRDHFYRLLLEPPEQRAQPSLAGTLEVGRFRADGLAADRPLIYTRGSAAHEVQVYHYHQWIEPPATLLQDQLVEYLRGAGIAERIVTPEMRAAAEHAVIGRVRRLEHAVGPPSSVHAELELGVRDNASNTLLLVRTYSEREPTAQETVDSAVQALGKAVSRIFARFASDVATH